MYLPLSPVFSGRFHALSGFGLSPRLLTTGSHVSDRQEADNLLSGDGRGFMQPVIYPSLFQKRKGNDA